MLILRNVQKGKKVAGKDRQFVGCQVCAEEKHGKGKRRLVHLTMGETKAYEILFEMLFPKQFDPLRLRQSEWSNLARARNSAGSGRIVLTGTVLDFCWHRTDLGHSLLHFYYSRANY